MSAATSAGAAGPPAPARKAHHTRGADQDDAPEITATIPATKPNPSAENPEALPPPFHLPNASRARMHECGLKWEALKMSGGAGDETWREFGTACLAENGEPDASH